MESNKGLYIGLGIGAAALSAIGLYFLFASETETEGKTYKLIRMHFLKFKEIKSKLGF